MSSYSEQLRDDAIAIFLFHGVIAGPHEGVRNYTRKHLTLDAFTEIATSLRGEGTPLAIDAALGVLAGRTPLPEGGFVISFDDGFRNNLTLAAPVLERLELPAVFYVTTGFVAGNGASWTDLVEFAVENAAVTELLPPWRSEVVPIGTREQKIAFLDDMRAVVKSRRNIDPYAFADELAEAAGAPPFAPDPALDAKLTPGELHALAAHPLFDVGGHGHTHRILGHLDTPSLEDELSTSIDLLETWLGAPLRHYSYPEGLAHSYSERVIDLLRARGIVSAPTAEPGTNPVGTDPFHLRRITVT